MEKGFTLLELLLVIAIMLILGGVSSIFFGRFLNQNAAANVQDQLIEDLRKAQVYSMSGKQNSTWGVRYDTSPKQIVLFKTGSTAFDEKFPMPNTVSVSGFTTITFGRLNGIPTAGVPSTTPTITISGGNNNTETLTINSQGVATR